MGKVTCLPGCITMIAVREEMAGAIRKYAEPVKGYVVLSHQVQYLVSKTSPLALLIHTANQHHFPGH